MATLLPATTKGKAAGTGGAGALARHALLLSITALGLLGCLLGPRVPQWQSYHTFADQRTVLGIPRFTDVITNLPFFIVAYEAHQLAESYRGRVGPGSSFASEAERRIFATLAYAVAGVGLGSSIYHLYPRNETLFFDRLGMGLAFCTCLAFLLCDRLSEETGHGQRQVPVGALAFKPLLALGAVGPVHWLYTELMHRGDLRLYALAQYLPSVLLPVLVFLYTSRYHCPGGTYRLAVALGLQLASKAIELGDKAVWYVTFKTVSGHSMHHLLAAMGLFTLVSYVRDRRYD